MHTRWIHCLWVFVLLFGGCADEICTCPGRTAPNAVPSDRITLNARLEELRAHYQPFLRSLPPPLPAPDRHLLDGEGWLSKYELAAQHSSVSKSETAYVPRPPAPEWFKPDLDERAWHSTSVPEWNYGVHGHKDGHGAILWYRRHFAATQPVPGRRVWLNFDGVDWFAEVWLNGQRLGEHAVYHETFRFDVTGVLREENVLAVRVTSGRRFGEPAAYWSVFPVINLPDDKPGRYTPDQGQSIIGFGHGDSHVGDGYGIQRSVYLETTGPVRIDEVFARHAVAESGVKLALEVDAASPAKASLQVTILPENFEGAPIKMAREVDLAAGRNELHAVVNATLSRTWSPDTPYLYRARVKIVVGGVTHAKDAVFGARDFGMVTAEKATRAQPEGLFLLNGLPVFLRGANIQGLNALYYWGERDKLLDILLMLRAANFNAVRSCQHVCFPEVLDLLDRVGLMSEQDQGTRGLETPATLHQVELAARALARATYNHPGVVLVSLANECNFDPTTCVQAVLAADPDRLIAPISGQMDKGGHMWIKYRENYPKLPAGLWPRVVNDVHQYWGWYGKSTAALWMRPESFEASGRMLIVGEYGSEALDSYETMRDRYPAHWEPVPSSDTDTLWGEAQVQKADRRQIFGARGAKPSTLAGYIAASQNYQNDQLTEVTRSWRLSPRKVAGYFQFHFVDVLPANWPKSIVSHDLRPKKAYYAMAQLNQPLVPLPVILDNGGQMRLWVANDTGRSDDHATIRYSVHADGPTGWSLAGGSIDARIRPYEAVEAGIVDLDTRAFRDEVALIDLELRDASNNVLARYAQFYFLRAWQEKEAVFGVPARGRTSRSASQPAVD